MGRRFTNLIAVLTCYTSHGVEPKNMSDLQLKAQVDRIRIKLADYQKTHNSRQSPQPIPLAELEKWESISQQTLPEAFRMFLLQIGVPAPCAFGSIETGFHCRPADQSVCTLTPENSERELWQQRWDTRESSTELYRGLFTFESQGCSLYTCVVFEWQIPGSCDLH